MTPGHDGAVAGGEWALEGGIAWIAAHERRLFAPDAGGRGAWERHGIAPLIQEAIRRGALAGVTSEAVAAVELRGRRIAHANLERVADLAAMLRSLREADVAAVSFKGPALAVLAYGDVGRREYADIDILVSPRDVDRAWACLVAEGYVPIPTLATPVPRRAPVLRAGRYHQAFLRRGTGRAIELHWALLPPALSPLVDAGRVRQRLREIAIGGLRVTTLGPEDLLLFLAVHGAKHAWSRLEWIADFAHLIIRQPNVDWGVVWADAAHRGADRMLALALALASQFAVGAVVPGTDHPVVRSDAVRRSAVEVWERRIWEAADPDDLENRHFQLRLLGRVRERALYYTQWVVQPSASDFAALNLPHSARGLYYLIRPLRLLGSTLTAERKSR
jgi:hypothetical protein